MDQLLSQSNVFSLGWFWPELILTTGVMVVFIADLVLRSEPRRVAFLGTITFGFLAVAGLALWVQPKDPVSLFNTLMVADPLAVFFKWVFLAAAGLAVWMVTPSREIEAERMGEYLALILAMTLGMFLMASASDLLMVYLSIEMVSLASYVLSGFRKQERRSAEAALKYVIYGGVASGIMVFGMSYLYGLTGTTDLQQLARGLADVGTRGKAAELALLVSIAFVLAGIGYKIASVPFHMWCPDVYEGAPTPFTAFLSVGPKAAGFAVALRFFTGALVSSPNEGLDRALHSVAEVPWPALLGVVAAATMTLGNMAALNQTNLKRLLAYSSIAHAGYLMMGLASGTNLGTLSVLMYLVFYLVMNVGAFAVVAAVARASGSESIFAYKGLGRRAPFLAGVFTLFLFSLTGIPPLAGFIGKFYLFFSVILRADVSGAADAAGWWSLAVLGVLNSAVSLFYYARVVKAMYLEQGDSDREVALPAGYTSLLAGLAAAVLLFGVYWAPISDAAEKALHMYQG